MHYNIGLDDWIIAIQVQIMKHLFLFRVFLHFENNEQVIYFAFETLASQDILLNPSPEHFPLNAHD